jgi:lipid-A-disaccharide synthase
VERKTFLIITGEISGDIHGYSIAKELLKHDNVKIYAVGGKNLKSLPVDVIDDISPYSSVGFTAFIPFIGKILRASRNIINFVKSNKIDVCICIDNQGFNIPLARKIKKLVGELIYFFPPIVSVWDRKNKKIVPALFDKILCPFYEDHLIYSQYTQNSYFTGHPFADTVVADKSPLEYKKNLNIKADTLLIGLFPGSRVQEIKTLLKPMLEAAALISKSRKCKFLLSASRKEFLHIARSNAEEFNISDLQIINESDYNLINACDVIIGASGSLAIEAALLKTPMVVLYKISKITYFIAKLLVKTDYISWPDIILKEEVFPELLQNKVRGDIISNACLELIEKNKNELNDKFEVFKKALGEKGVIVNTANLIYGETN